MAKDDDTTATPAATPATAPAATEAPATPPVPSGPATVTGTEVSGDNPVNIYITKPENVTEFTWAAVKVTRDPTPVRNAELAMRIMGAAAGAGITIVREGDAK